MSIATWVTPEGAKVRCLTFRIQHTLDLSEMIDGLCSEFWRHLDAEGPDVPSKMSRARVLESIRREYTERGTTHVWTWLDNPAISDQVANKARSWARRVILDAFPEMDDQSS